MNIIHMKKDGKEDEQAVEKKYRWDEENRLLASDKTALSPTIGMMPMVSVPLMQAVRVNKNRIKVREEND